MPTSNAKVHDWIVTVTTSHYEEVRASSPEGARQKALQQAGGAQRAGVHVEVTDIEPIT